PLVGRGAVGYLVFAHRRAGFTDLRGGFDVGGVELVELVDVSEHLAQVGQKLPFVLGAEFEPRQTGDVTHLLDAYLVNGHSAANGNIAGVSSQAVDSRRSWPWAKIGRGWM